MKLNVILIVLSLSLVLIEVSIAEDKVKFQSSAKQTTLIELFTSQGCSSCPPADRWLNSFTDDPRLWNEIVPIAFHINYWDRLGWKDPFATEKFTERQYNYSRSGKINSVYTPCLIVNGKEWRGWFSGNKLNPDSTESGVLTATLIGDKLEANYTENNEPLELHVVILGFDLYTDIRRGENRNKRLRQEFVALSHEKYKSSDGHWSVKLDKIPNNGSKRIGIALWLTKTGSIAPIQATGGWLPDDTTISQ